MPEYVLADAKREKVEGADEWRVTVHVTNKGTGTMPIEVCATRGERFDDDERDGDAEPASDNVVQAAERASRVSSDYRDARTTVTLAAGESKDVELRCAFEPEHVLVDPECLVLQLRREKAVIKL
jgi:hypothetical protein